MGGYEHVFPALHSACAKLVPAVLVHVIELQSFLSPPLCGTLSLARVVQRGRQRSMAADVFVVGCVGGSHQEHHRLFCSLASPWERLPCGEQQVLQELGEFACHVSDFRISNNLGHIKQASLAHIRTRPVC